MKVLHYRDGGGGGIASVKVFAASKLYSQVHAAVEDTVEYVEKEKIGGDVN